MPKPVGKTGHAAPVIGCKQLSVRTDVGDVGQRLVAKAVFHQHGGGGLGVQLAVKTLREIDLLRIGKFLVAEYQDIVFVHPASDGFERRRIGYGTKVDAACFCSKQRV